MSRWRFEGRGMGRCVRATPIVLLLLAATVAQGEEDGGTLSPFAHGAGGRALGMGGAFVATADDACALIWNPGGLARLARLEFEVDYARFDESASGEHFAAVALPSWRWGVVGLTVRHLAVDGVEQRDAQNVLVPGDIAGAETEIALGYARNVAPGIGLGAAMKLQRVGVGAVAGTGYGADLGLAVDAEPWIGDRISWAAPLSFGLSVRNALEPTQRLDQDEVADPRVLRLGLAWQQEVSGSTALRLAADLEQGGGPAARLHVGAELTLGGLLALRTGLDGELLTAGTSVQWQGFSVDYAYEQRDLGATQRIGLSKAIGATVSESREATRAAQERELGQRLAKVYEERLREQVAGFLTRGEAAQAAGRTDEALEAVAAARALAPGDTHAVALEATIERGEGERLERVDDPAGAAASYGRALEAWPGDSLASAGRRRAQQALARLGERSKRSRQLDEAFRLFGAGDLAAARATFSRVAATGDSTSAAMVSRIDAMLGTRITSRLARAQRDLRDGLLDEVERGIQEALALGARDSAVAGLRSALEAQRRRPAERPVAAASRAPSARAPSEGERREADQLYRRGAGMASAKQTEGAVRYWELALALDPNHAGARSALEREYVLRGMAAFGRGRFAEAEAAWARVLELDPSDARTRAYLERARTQIDRTRELTGGRR